MNNIFFKGPADSVMLPLQAEFLTSSGSSFKLNFKARYRRPTAEERKDIIERIGTKPSPTISDEEILNKLLTGWTGIQDTDSNPIEFTPENLAAAMDIPEYREALVNGALTLVYGKKTMERVAAAKNSSTPAVTG